MADLPRWRALFGKIIDDPRERQRLAEELKVKEVTLTRWVHNTASPRPQNIRNLLTALEPPARQKLLEAILEEFPDFVSLFEDVFAEEPSKTIPVEFYDRVLDAYAQLAGYQRYLSITSSVLQQAVGQLTPRTGSIAVTIAQCMRPLAGSKIRSLHERAGKATHPWKPNLELKAIFLGAESLAGQAVVRQREQNIPSKAENKGIIPAQWVEGEESAAAYPIIRGGKIAGALVVSCSLPRYFTDSQLRLIRGYSRLVALAFEPDDFYDIGQIALRRMPPYKDQEARQKGLQQKVSTYMQMQARDGQPVDLLQAQRHVLQIMEEEFLQFHEM
jgi:hypothetical protein